MSNSLTKFLLLGLLLLLIVSPFAALAPLVVVLVGFVLVWMSWTFIRTLATGETDQRDRLSDNPK
ncbi:hypothetical protein IFO70_17875 [Phormidium tenue FACHB-886]|nr:hypothetical protein [Phormidium tenue FACHB-886]